MNQVYFRSSSVPLTFTEMNSLLEQCTPENMAPIKEKLTLPDELVEGSHLPVQCFLQAVAYPLQSYPVDGTSKLIFVQQVRRLYPKPSLVGRESTIHELAMKSLLQILKRLDPLKKIPIGLDGLSPQKEVLPSVELIKYTTLVQNPIEIRIQEIEAAFPHREAILSDKEMAIGYQVILNLLLLEAKHIHTTWLLEESNAIADVCAERFYKFSATIIRTCYSYETNLGPHCKDEEENDFAFAIQRISLLDFLQQLTNISDAKVASRKKETLLKMYRNIKMAFLHVNNPRVLHTLAAIEKDLTRLNRQPLCRDLNVFISEYYTNIQISRFFEHATQELIAPYHAALLKEHQTLHDMNLQAFEEFRITQCRDKQSSVNRKALCEAYTETRIFQNNLYVAIYRKLNQLVHRQKQRRDWLYFFKYLTPNKSSGEALPEALPPCLLAPFDLALKLFEAVEKPPSLIESIHSSSHDSKNKYKKTPKTRQVTTALPPQEKSPDSSDAEEPLPQKEESFEKALERDPSSIPESLPTLIAKQLSPFSYASRVARWFNDLRFPLDQNQFPEYGGYQESYQRRMVAYHAFSCTVDFYIKELALETIWKNPRTHRLNVRYILPSEISLPGFKKTRGAIVYTVDTQTNELYHRFFSEKKTEELVEKVSIKTFQEIDFPELSSLFPECSSSPPYKPLSSQQEEEISIHPFLGTVTIKSKRSAEKISLFRVRPLEE